MSLFSFDASRTLTTTADATPVRARGGAARAARARAGRIVRDDGVSLSDSDLTNQFIVYQLSKESEGPALLDSTAVIPSIEGSDEQPDVLARLNLVSFHVGDESGIDRSTRATMRITFGKDPASTTRILDTAFWAIAAGLKLHNEGKAAQDKQLAADLNRAFANRPIEIAGGLGILSFEVVKHEEPRWWQKVFRFLDSGAGRGLTSALGFPAITQPALALVDELLERLNESRPEVLFKSAPMRLALSQRAHEEFTGGSARVKLGSLDSGYCVLARGKDRDALLAVDPVFYPTHGILAPASADPGDANAMTRTNPLHGLTYAVFRVQTKAAQLDPDFNFR
jgi:hypothetical protein